MERSCQILALWAFPVSAVLPKKNRAWKFFQYNGFVSMDLPEKHLDGADIHCAKHGWMLMSKTDLTMFFYNPFNNETIHLPKADSKYRVICFFHPPTSRDCFVIGARTERPSDVIFGVLRPRWDENKWTSCVYHCSSRFRLSLCTPVLRQQRLVHFLAVDGNIGVFDVGRSGSPDSWTVQTECLLVVELQFPGKIVQHFLVELRDEQQVLLSVLVGPDERQVNVFGMLLSGPRRKWAPVEGLGDKALFVSRRACFAVTAPWRSMANRIYFAKLHGDGDDLVYYCLATRRYHSCNGEFSSKDSFHFKDLSFATWITAPPVFPSDQ